MEVEIVNSQSGAVEFFTEPTPGAVLYTSIAAYKCGILSVPISRTLTALENRNSSYETAYEGIDYLREVFSGTQLAETSNWSDLRMEHHKRTDWVEAHSLELT